LRTQPGEDANVSSLAGKVVAITGGGTGIGAGIARGLAEAGCKVTVGGRRIEPLEKLSASISSPHSVHTHVIDVADAESVKAFFSDIKRDVGDVDILINSAGINIQKRTMAAMSPEDWDRVLAINATGAYRCMCEVLPAMRARKDGLIINISSIAGKRAISLGGIAYCASKFAMTALGTAVSNEVRLEGVRVTNVYPGEVNTPILENRPTPVTQEHKDSILQPEDIASVVVTICALPPRAHVPEIVVKPTIQEWV
jgi:NADP-dependent 3-hydroxy acid dehydrogenase YdfG